VVAADGMLRWTGTVGGGGGHGRAFFVRGWVYWRECCRLRTEMSNMMEIRIHKLDLIQTNRRESPSFSKTEHKLNYLLGIRSSVSSGIVFDTDNSTCWDLNRRSWAAS
jgi:hypothetical protein